MNRLLFTQIVPQEILPDTAADTSAVVDTSGTIDRISRDLGEASDLLVRGEWSLFWSQLYEGAAEMIVAFIPNLIKATFVFLIFYAVYRASRSVVNSVLHRSRRVDQGLENLVMKSFRIAMLTFIVIMTLAQFGINVTSLVAGLSIIGLAVGFAARDTLENFISGIAILLDRPFRVGDQVEVDGTYGTVMEISLRSTRLRTLNNTVMVMPNVQMINQKLINHAMLGLTRVQIPFGIAYKESIDAAREAVLATTRGDERLDENRPATVVVTALGNSSVDMELRVFLRDPSHEVPVRFEYVEKAKKALDAAGIEIPFPHLQLFIDEAKAFENAPLLNPPPSR